jgi:hypothetical protein
MAGTSRVYPRADNTKIAPPLGNWPNINRFADAIAEKLAAELFDVNGSLFWLEAGGPASLHNLITQHFVSIRLGGTVDKPNGEIEYFSFEFPPGGKNEQGARQKGPQ